MSGKLAVVAGTGPMRALVTRLARERGEPHEVFAIAPLLPMGQDAPSLHPFRFAQILDMLRRDDIGSAYLCGNFPLGRQLQAALCGYYAPLATWIGDRLFIDTMLRTSPANSYAIRYLASLGLLLADAGVRLRCARDVFPQLAIRAGTLTRHAPDERILAATADVMVALEKAFAKLPQRRVRLAQAGIVEDGRITSIEWSSTDRLLRRARREAGRSDTRYLVKMPSVGFEPALDQPTIGPKTAQGCIDAGLSGLIVCAELTLLIEPKRTIDLLDRAGLFLHALPLAEVCRAYQDAFACDWAEWLAAARPAHV